MCLIDSRTIVILTMLFTCDNRLYILLKNILIINIDKIFLNSYFFIAVPKITGINNHKEKPR